MEKTLAGKVNELSEFLGCRPEKVSSALGLKTEEELSFIRKIESVQTVGEAWMAHHLIPRGSAMSKRAMEKWLSLCTSIEEAKEAYDASAKGSEEENMAIRKVAEFLK